MLVKNGLVDRPRKARDVFTGDVRQLLMPRVLAPRASGLWRSGPTALRRTCCGEPLRIPTFVLSSVSTSSIPLLAASLKPAPGFHWQIPEPSGQVLASSCKHSPLEKADALSCPGSHSLFSLASFSQASFSRGIPEHGPSHPLMQLPMDFAGHTGHMAGCRQVWVLRTAEAQCSMQCPLSLVGSLTLHLTL